MKMIAIVFAMFTALAFGQSEKAKPADKPAQKTETKAPRRQFVPPPINYKYAAMPYTRGVTFENYDYLRDGMSYSDAAEVLGTPGQEISSTSIGGIRTVMYSWKAKDGIGNMNAMFQNDKLITKAQFGLK